MSTTTDLQKMINLFNTITDLFEKFVGKVNEEILSPFFAGEEEVFQENLKKINKSLTIDKLLKLITKTLDELISLKISLDRNYNTKLEEGFNLDSASKELDEKLQSLVKFQRPIN